MFDCKMIYTSLDKELESQKKKYEDIKERENLRRNVSTDSKRLYYADVIKIII